MSLLVWIYYPTHPHFTPYFVFDSLQPDKRTKNCSTLSFSISLCHKHINIAPELSKLSSNHYKRAIYLVRKSSPEKTRRNSSMNLKTKDLRAALCRACSSPAILTFLHCEPNSILIIVTLFLRKRTQHSLDYFPPSPTSLFTRNLLPLFFLYSTAVHRLFVNLLQQFPLSYEYIMLQKMRNKHSLLLSLLIR